MRTESPLRYIALTGATAAGKTAAAMAIAQQHRIEIISVDSALVYRGMDIGTAKPSAAERAAVSHHLIDIRDPLQPYSAAEFASDAQSLIAAITARGRLPLLVGGTMLYFKALIDGLDAMPKADPAVRAALEAQARGQGWPALHAELARCDPVTAARLQPFDAQRIGRALEVWRLTGRPLSSFHSGQARRERGDLAQHESLLISLEPLERSWLHQRIAQRFDAMLASGLLDEVRALRARADLHADLPAMRCVGYRQAWEYLDAHEARGLDAQETRGLDANDEHRLNAHDAHRLEDPAALHELRDKGIFATRQLAKRQLTWLRSMPQRQIVAADAPDALDQVLALTRAFACKPAVDRPRDDVALMPSLRAQRGNPGAMDRHGLRPRDDEVVAPLDDWALGTPRDDEVVAPLDDWALGTPRDDEVLDPPREDELLAPSLRAQRGNPGAMDRHGLRPRDDEALGTPRDDEVVGRARDDGVVVPPRDDGVVVPPRDDGVVVPPRDI